MEYIRCIFVMVVFVGCVTQGTAQEVGSEEIPCGSSDLDDWDKRVCQIQSQAVVRGSGVLMPKGVFLLIRSHKDTCALRFTDFHRGRDKKEWSVFHSGEENLYSQYDWFYQGDGSGDFSKANVESGHESLRRGPIVGFGHMFGSQVGNTNIECGSFELSWSYPTTVYFWNAGKRRESRDRQLEIAPTKWKNISELNALDPNLIWYSYYEGIAETIIPLEELPP